MAGAASAFANDPLWGKRFEVLLGAAKQLRDNDHNEAAIVTAQTACEVCTEIVLTLTFQSRGIDYLNDPLGHLLSNYNVGNERVRRLYEAVTDDLISKTSPHWSSFQKHVKKRNDVVHSGEQATRAEADASIAVAAEIIEHIKQHYYARWL